LIQFIQDARAWLVVQEIWSHLFGLPKKFLQLASPLNEGSRGAQLAAIVELAVIFLSGRNACETWPISTAFLICIDGKQVLQ
jgi:hypothetical protein